MKTEVNMTQLVKERITPWVLFLEDGVEFTAAEAQDAANRIDHGPRVRVPIEPIRRILDWLIDEGFLQKNLIGRRVTYTRVKYE